MQEESNGELAFFITLLSETMGIFSIIIRDVATNSGLGVPGSNRDLFCVVST